MAGGASGKRKSAEASDIAVSKKRAQVSRRFADDKIDRCLAMHVHPFLSKQIVETEKVDGKLLRDAVAEAMEEVPGRHRLGALFWRECFASMAVAHPCLPSCSHKTLLIRWQPSLLLLLGLLHRLTTKLDPWTVWLLTSALHRS